MTTRPSGRSRPGLVLHAGTLKTGTTSVQRVLADNREWLREHGVVYPDTRPNVGGSREAHFRITSAFNGLDAGLLAAARATLASLAADAGSRTVVLSSEPVSLYRAGAAAWTLLAVQEHWARRRAYLQSLAAGLSAFQTTIMLVLRRQDDFAESLYREIVSKGFTDLAFDEFIDLWHPLFEYRRQVDAFREAFDDVQTLSYHDRPVIQSVCDVIGIPLPPGAAAVWERRSPDARLTLWMLRQPVGERALQRAFAMSQAGRDLYARDVPRTLWSSDARVAFVERVGSELVPTESGASGHPARPIGSLGRRDAARIDAAYRCWQRAEQVRPPSEPGGWLKRAWQDR